MVTSYLFELDEQLGPITRKVTGIGRGQYRLDVDVEFRPVRNSNAACLQDPELGAKESYGPRNECVRAARSARFRS